MEKGAQGFSLGGRPGHTDPLSEAWPSNGEKGQTQCSHLWWGRRAAWPGTAVELGHHKFLSRAFVTQPGACTLCHGHLSAAATGTTLDLHQETTNLSHFPQGAGRPCLTLLRPGWFWPPDTQTDNAVLGMFPRQTTNMLKGRIHKPHEEAEGTKFQQGEGRADRPFTKVPRTAEL